MVPFFVGYALVVWYFVAKHRRSLHGLGVLGLGVFGLMLINYAHWLMYKWSAARDPEGVGFSLPVLQALMYPYTALVALIGLYILVLPRRRAEGCFRCGYDVSGLASNRCPECGAVLATAHRASGTERGDLRVSDLPSQSAEEESGDDAQPENRGGEPEQQRPL